MIHQLCVCVHGGWNKSGGMWSRVSITRPGQEHPSSAKQRYGLDMVAHGCSWLLLLLTTCSMIMFAEYSSVRKDCVPFNRMKCPSRRRSVRRTCPSVSTRLGVNVAPNASATSWRLGSLHHLNRWDWNEVAGTMCFLLWWFCFNQGLWWSLLDLGSQHQLGDWLFVHLSIQLGTEFSENYSNRGLPTYLRTWWPRKQTTAFCVCCKSLSSTLSHSWSASSMNVSVLS